MPETLESALARLHGLLTQGAALRRAIATGRTRHTQPRWRRVELRPVRLRAGTALQITTFDARQSHTRVCAFGPEAERRTQELLRAGFGHWHVDTADATWQLRVTKRGEAMVHRGPATAGAEAAAPDLAHNRDKQRLLPASDPLWQALGMGDGRGGIKPGSQNKFRQVDAFLRLMAPLTARLAQKQNCIDIVDLGCGNAALTFAAYRYLTDRCGINARLTGVDVKAQARARNQALAGDLGYDDVHFVEGSIRDARTPRADVALALHACDTATDEALARAIAWQAEVILAAPCCHHHVQAQLREVTAPPAFNTVLRHGILSERWADVLTDALRAAILRQRGWRTDVVEFIASEHTPRNTLLRAVRTDAGPDTQSAADYRALCKLWQVRPYLESLLKAP